MVSAVAVGLGPRRDPPGRGPLVDTFGRVHRHLRISVTDRCNLRCTYCLPDGPVPVARRDALLSFEEIAAVAAVARRLGVRSVRLTGGEPLVRRDLPRLVGLLAALGFDDLALTTNGTALAAHAAALAAAGLRRVNVSCDSLRPDRFAAVRRRGALDTVLGAMDAAESAGLGPVKVNVVVMRGVNDDEVVDFAAFSRRTGRPVRFIEFMPLDGPGRWAPDRVVPAADVLAAVSAAWPLGPAAGGVGPARCYRFTDGAPGEVGVIPTVTDAFCGDCDRLRLTAEGAVRNCLFSDDELSVRDVLRAGGGDGEVERVLRRAVWGKAAGHGIGRPGFVKPARAMSAIGG